MSIKQLVTAEDLWEMPEVPGKRIELVDGEIVEVPGSGMLHNLIAALVYELVRDHVRGLGLGYVFTDGVGYILRRNPDVLRIPDVSFLSRDRVPEAGIPEGFSPVAPDLAVEVVSPHDRAADVQGKVREYLEAGTRMVLVLWPRGRSVTVHEPGGITHELGPDDELDGGEVLPGFRVRVAKLFDVDGSY